MRVDLVLSVSTHRVLDIFRSFSMPWIYLILFLDLSKRRHWKGSLRKFILTASKNIPRVSDA